MQFEETAYYCPSCKRGFRGPYNFALTRHWGPCQKPNNLTKGYCWVHFAHGTIDEINKLVAEKDLALEQI